MTLLEACRLAYACGLETVGETVLNVQLHHGAFDVDVYRELYEDINNRLVTYETRILDIFTEEELSE